MLAPDGALRTHWGPDPGPYLTWHLLPAGGGPLAGVAAAHAAALAAVPFLDLVPTPWLHLTVQGVGPDAEVAARIDDVVAATRRHLDGLAPVHLTFGPPTVFLEGVLLEGTPAEPVAALRTALRRGITDVLGEAPGADDEPAWPHASLAYVNAPAPAARALAAMASVPGSTVTETFPEVSLIRLVRAGRLYRWDVVATVPLTG